jgi:translation elongation factor EF-4
MELTKQDWALIHELIGLAWQAGAVKSPQQAQGIEQLRAKVVAKIEPPKEQPKKEAKQP